MMRCFGMLLLAGLVALIGATPASAAWSRARLMTSVGTEQAMYPASTLSDVTMRPDLSADGRYVAFASTAKNLLAGLGPEVQEDATGAVFRRAIDGGTVEVVAVTNTTGAVSISANGRYVAFGSFRALLPEDADTIADVYVRDMEAPDGGLILASAEADAATTLPNEASLSADGSRVLLRAGSELSVRDLDTEATIPVTDSMVNVSDPPSALSADGSTVVWDDLTPQERTSPSEYLPSERPVGKDPRRPESVDWDGTTEILWRRLDQPLARRVATAGDVEDPACDGRAFVPDTTLALEGIRNACDGLFRFGVGSPGTFASVSLSYDGRMLAFTTSGPRRTGSSIGVNDVLVRDMHAPGGRKQTTRELSRFIGDGTTRSVSMAADGSAVAFASKSDRTTLSAPTLISAGVGVRPESDVYIVDLRSDTIDRVSRAYTGELANGSSDRPVISGDGSRVAFASVATNLLFGDANGAADVFVADRFDDSQPPLPETGIVQPGIAAAGADRATEISPSWRLNVTVSRGGSVLYVDARVPARGTVTATARSTRRVRGRSTLKVIRKGASRTAAPGTTRVRLRLPVKYRSAARRRAGLPVRVTVQFRPSGRGGTLTRHVNSVFRYRARSGAKR